MSKCTICGEELTTDGHVCRTTAFILGEELGTAFIKGGVSEPYKPNTESLDSIVLALRDILEELKKFNEREQEKEYGKKVAQYPTLES